MIPNEYRPETSVDKNTEASEKRGLWGDFAIQILGEIRWLCYFRNGNIL